MDRYANILTSNVPLTLALEKAQPLGQIRVRFREGIDGPLHIFCCAGSRLEEQFRLAV